MFGGTRNSQILFLFLRISYSLLRTSVCSQMVKGSWLYLFILTNVSSALGFFFFWVHLCDWQSHRSDGKMLQLQVLVMKMIHCGRATDGWCLPNQMQWVGFLVRNRLKEKLGWACVGLLSVEGEKRIASELLLHSLLLWIAVFVCFRLYSNDMVKTCSISTTVRFHWLSCSFLTFGLIKFVVCGNIHKSSLFNNWDLGSWDLITLQDYLVK